MPHQLIKSFLSVVATLVHRSDNNGLVDAALIREEGLEEVKGLLLGIDKLEARRLRTVRPAVRTIKVRVADRHHLSLRVSHLLSLLLCHLLNRAGHRRLHNLGLCFDKAVD